MNEEDFLRALRGALRHLYDHTVLRRSPLNDLLSTHMHAQGLQGILLDAVHALSPARGTSLQSDARRTHRILLHRYVEQFSQSEVADSLGLSPRQLRRQEQLAIHALGEYLRARYSLSVTSSELQGDRESGADQVDERAAAAPYQQYQEDLEWLHQSARQEFLDPGELITDALHTLEPLFQTLNLAVQSHWSPNLPRVAGNAIALRQALVITLTAVARLAAGRKMSITATAQPNEMRIDIQPAARQGDASLEMDENVIMAQRLLALSGGLLSIYALDAGNESSAANPKSNVVITLPLVQPETVLIIDDNRDALLLMQRYLTDTRYHAVVTRDPLEGLALAQDLVPQVILLDVMLPGIDGWGVLTRLRRHPATAQIPVIICTILPEEQLALALGASGFLRKPLTSDDLLETLRAVKPSPELISVDWIVSR